MATTFTGLRVQDTYNAIIKIGNNSNLSGTAKILSDGVGNSSSIYLSTTRLGIGITPAYQFHTSGNAKIGGNLIISGNLTVNGTLTYLNVEDLAVEDPLIKLAKDNTANTLDIGFFGKYVATGTKYKGLFNDASDDKFKLFIGTGTEPTTTVDISASGYSVGTLVANLEGNVTGGTISGTTGSFSGDLSANNLSGTNTGDQTLPTDFVSKANGGTFGGDITIAKTDPTITLYDNSGANTDPNGKIIFSEVANTTNFEISYNGLNDRLEFNGLVSGNFTDLVYINRNTTTPLTVLGGATFSGLVTGIAPTSDLNFATKKYVDDSTGDVDVAKRIEITVKNVSGSSLVKGAAVHASPTATPPSGNVIEVIGADNDVTGSMPAIGILNEAIADEAEGQCVMVGSVTGINTSSFTAGEELYIGSTLGVLTNTKPTSTSNQIQKIAVVIKVHATNGSIEVFGAGRANDVPNLVDRTITFDPSINISATSGYGRIEIGGPSGGFIDLKAPASDDYDLRLITSSGGNEITTASGDLKINTSNTLALTIDSSQNATFASRVIIGEDAITTDKPGLVVGDTTNGGQITVRGLSPTLFFDKTSTGNPKILTDSGTLEIKKGTLDAEGTLMFSLTDSTSYFANTNLGIKRTNPISALEVKGNGDAPSYFTHSYGVDSGLTVAGDESLIEIISTDSGSHGGSFNIRGGNKGYSFINNPDSFRLEFKYFEADANNFNTHSSGGNVSTLNDLLFIDKVGLATFWGKLGVGINPTEKLHVNGKALITDDIQLTGSNPRIDFNSNGSSSLRFYDITATEERARFDTAGNILINTQTTSFDTAKIGSGHKFLNVQSPSEQYAVATLAGNSATNDNRLGYLTFVNDNNSATYKYTAWLGAESEGTTANQRGSRLIFSTASDGSSAGPIKRMFINSTGNIGMGAGFVAATKLHIKGDGDRMQISSADYDLVKIGAFGTSGADIDNGFLNLLLDGVEKIRLLASGDSYFNGGNVGFGESDPEYKIDIGGSGSEINLKGGNNRIRFSGHRALEGATDATLLQIGEGYGTARMYGRVGFGISPGTGNTVHIYKNATIGAITSTTTANGGLRIQDSGASMYFDGNSIVLDNTGYITTNGTHDFVLGTNNTARLHIDAAGYIGIANTDPSNKLHIYHNDSMGNPSSFDATKAGLRIQDSANDLYLDGNGVITTGSADLFIGATSNQGIRFYTNASWVAQIDSFGQTKFYNNVSLIVSDTETNQSAGTDCRLFIENTSDTDGCIGVIDFKNHSTFVTARIGAQFQDADDKNTDLYFMTRANSGTLDERMRITSAGRVTIKDKPNSGLAYDLLISVGTGADGDVGYQTQDQLASNLAVNTNSNWIKTGNDLYNSNSGNIGINESNPSRLLTIKGGASGETGTINAHTQIFIENDDDAYIETRVPSTKLTGLRFTDNTISAGGVIYAHNNSSYPNMLGLGAWAAISFRVSGISGVFEKTEKMRIAENGIIYIMGATASVNNSLQMQYNSTAGTAEIYAKSTTGNTTFEFYTSESGTTSERVKILSDGTLQVTNTTSPKFQLKRSSKQYTTRIDNGDKFVIQEEGGAEFFVVESGANAQSIRIDSSGNVGINNSDPAQKLDVSGKIRVTDDIILAQTNGRIDFDNGSSSGALRFHSTSAGEEKMRIESNGRVGITTDNPDESLHIKLATGDPRIKLETGGGGDPGIIFQSANNRTGEMYFQDGSTSARFSYDHAGIAFKMYAHNQSSIDFYLSETMAYFPQQNVGIGTNTVVKDFQLDFSSASTDLTSTLAGAPAGPGALIQNTNTTVNNFANLDFRSNNADARIACQYITANTAWFRFVQDNAGTLQNTATLKSNGDFSVIGDITATGDVIAFSDKKVKTNIKTINNSLEKISKLRGVSYNRTDIEDKSDKIGVIAQEVKKVLPEVVNYDDEKDLLGVDYGKMAGVFIEAIKELKAEVDSLKQEIKELKK